MKRWYVDACVLVAYFSNKRTEKENKKIAKRIFSEISEAVDLELVTSYWTLTELTKILIKSHAMDRDKIVRITTDLIRRGRIEGAKIKLIDLSPKSDYNFSEMCSDLQDGAIKYTVGFQDVLHTIIMKNNGIDTILTFDSGFKKIDGLNVVEVDEQ